jgi:uncharacterized protein (DUF2225 family)
MEGFEEFEEQFDQSKEVEAFQQAIARRIILESDRLVDELFGIVFDPDTDPRTKLSAISMLMDRGIPKLGIKHTKEEESEERGSRKQLREEIEKLIKEQSEEEDE